METNFDWEFYLLYNNDIISNFDNNEKEILEHYNKYGRNENRIINEINLYKSYPFIKFFDWKYYFDNNLDLQIFKSKFQLYKHFLTQGYTENRNINFHSSIYSYFNLLQDTCIFNHKNIPKISIIIPVYNTSKLLKSCINSILNQSYSNIEIIIINDSSNDESLNIINEFENNDKIIILSNIINYGCYTAINNALHIASGDYITIHGSDDISLPNRFNILMSYILDNNLLMCGNYILRSHLDIFDDINILNTRNIFNSIITQNLFNQKHNHECCKALVSLGTLIYHKSVFNTIGEFENIRKGGDMIFFEKFLYHYDNFKFYKNDCSHRYLTNNTSGTNYKIIDEILYISSELNSNNLTFQNIPFDINYYREKIYN